MLNSQDSRALLEECLRVNGELRVPSIGTSMWPDLCSGDELRLKNVTFAELAAGDIVLFQHDEALLAHRVLKVYAESGRAMLLVKGDNRSFADPPIFYEQVIGRVEEAWRDGRSVYQRGAGRKGRWKAWRSHLQERFWGGVIDRVLGARPVSAETRAVFALVSYTLDRTAEPSFPATLDWERVHADARKGRLTPLLAGKLPGGLPDWFQARCTRELRENLGTQLFLYDQLERMLLAFQHAGLHVMVIKGPVVADGLYANPGWRPMVDLDLVVRADEWSRAIEVLQTLEYVPEHSNWSELTADMTGQIALLKTGGPLIAAVELHRDLKFLSERMAVRGEVDIARAWRNARPYACGEASALALSREDALAYACTHWAQHHFFSSIWLVDIALMAAQPGLSWDTLVRQTHEDGTAHFVWCGLFLAQALFAAHVPSEVLTALQPPGRKGALVRHLLWEKALTSFSEQADARSLALQVLLFTRWRGTLAGLRAGIFPSAVWLHQHYTPEAASPGRIRLLLRHWRNLGRLAGGRTPLEDVVE